VGQRTSVCRALGGPATPKRGRVVTRDRPSMGARDPETEARICPSIRDDLKRPMAASAARSPWESAMTSWQQWQRLTFAHVRRAVRATGRNGVAVRVERTRTNGRGRSPRIDKLGVTVRAQYRPPQKAPLKRGFSLGRTSGRSTNSMDVSEMSASTASCYLHDCEDVAGIIDEGRPP
jgi:hypothetical protein